MIPKYALRLARLKQQTTAIGGGGVTRLIWSTGGIGHVTQQNRNNGQQQNNETETVKQVKEVGSPVRSAVEAQARSSWGCSYSCSNCSASASTREEPNNTYKKDIAQINTSAMRNMMLDDRARWLVQGKIKWGAHISHEMINTLTYGLIQIGKF